MGTYLFPPEVTINSLLSEREGLVAKSADQDNPDAAKRALRRIGEVDAELSSLGYVPPKPEKAGKGDSKADGADGAKAQ